MILRHRQIGGNPLTKGQGFVATLVGAVGVVLIARFFWIPFFDISEEFQRPFLLIGVVVYIISCSGIVKKNNERAQLFFGGYTGVSFPAGIYLLPRLPFPLISLVLHFLFSLFNKEVGPYLGWVLEGDVSVHATLRRVRRENLEPERRFAVL